jgi:hypothetical protein
MPVGFASGSGNCRNALGTQLTLATAARKKTNKEKQWLPASRSLPTRRLPIDFCHAAQASMSGLGRTRLTQREPDSSREAGRYLTRRICDDAQICV